jgi:hypothetical protein
LNWKRPFTNKRDSMIHSEGTGVVFIAASG